MEKQHACESYSCSVGKETESCRKKRSPSFPSTIHCDKRKLQPLEAREDQPEDYPETQLFLGIVVSTLPGHG